MGKSFLGASLDILENLLNIVGIALRRVEFEEETRKWFHIESCVEFFLKLPLLVPDGAERVCFFRLREDADEDFRLTEIGACLYARDCDESFQLEIDLAREYLAEMRSEKLVYLFDAMRHVEIKKSIHCEGKNGFCQKAKQERFRAYPYNHARTHFSKNCRIW